MKCESVIVVLGVLHLSMKQQSLTHTSGVLDLSMKCESVTVVLCWGPAPLHKTSQWLLFYSGVRSSTPEVWVSDSHFSTPEVQDLSMKCESVTVVLCWGLDLSIKQQSLTHTLWGAAPQHKVWVSDCCFMLRSSTSAVWVSDCCFMLRSSTPEVWVSDCCFMLRSSTSAWSVSQWLLFYAEVQHLSMKQQSVIVVLAEVQHPCSVSQWLLFYAEVQDPA